MFRAQTKHSQICKTRWTGFDMIVITCIIMTWWCFWALRSLYFELSHISIWVCCVRFTKSRFMIYHHFWWYDILWKWYYLSFMTSLHRKLQIVRIPSKKVICVLPHGLSLELINNGMCLQFVSRKKTSKSVIWKVFMYREELRLTRAVYEWTRKNLARTLHNWSSISFEIEYLYQ